MKTHNPSLHPEFRKMGGPPRFCNEGLQGAYEEQPCFPDASQTWKQWDFLSTSQEMKSRRKESLEHSAE